MTISSTSIPSASPATVWTVNVRTCTEKYNDWITTKAPVASVLYDVRNPPSSPVIATYTYLGPPLGACGNPTIAVTDGNDGPNLAFLTASFDAATGVISISLPDNSVATKGDYSLYAVFTVPGSFSFPLGVSLEIFDICNDSVFPSAPVLVPDLQNYYTNQGDLVVEASWQEDSVSATTENECGVYTISATLNSATSTITSGAVDP